MFYFPDITVSDPLFDGMSSYLSVRMVNVRHSMDVILSFKPLSSEGLLFYAAQHLNELSRDFISLSLTSGYVQLRFNLGTDPSSTVILNTFKKVENSKMDDLCLFSQSHHFFKKFKLFLNYLFVFVIYICFQTCDFTQL